MLEIIQRRGLPESWQATNTAAFSALFGAKDGRYRAAGRLEVRSGRWGDPPLRSQDQRSAMGL